MSFSNDNLEILGTLASAASYPEYTRMTTPLSKPNLYVEFLTASIATPTPPLRPGLQDLFVSVNTPLYFSDYTTPATGILPANGSARGRFLPGNPQVTPTGLELYDGSPMIVQKEKGRGPICGLSGTAKDGTSFTLSLSPYNAELPGRVAETQASWVFCRADLSVGGLPQFSMSMGLSPQDLLATISLRHENINSAIGVDLAPATGDSPSANLTRAITYYKQTVSTVTVKTQDGSDPPVQIATSPLHQFASMTDLMSSALATVLGQVAGNTGSDPLTALGSLDINYPETQAAFVSRGMALTGGACAGLALLLSGSPIPGFSDLAQWIGWSMGSLAAPNLNAALTKSYTDFEASRLKQGVAANHGGWRSILGSQGGLASKEAIDKVLDNACQL
jgi:hypothetical protein